MHLTFLGAARTVTGSRYLIETDHQRILVDCGLFQGLKELRMRNWEPFPILPASIDAVVLTHGHIDHSGYLPLLVRNGFRGKVYCSLPTLDLCKLLLPDSAHIHEEDARRANRYQYSKHTPALPLYTIDDAHKAVRHLHATPFGKDITIGPNISIRLERNGHILGSASVLLRAEGRSILFSGDVGRSNDPVMKAPNPPLDADYLVIESTYGNRKHVDIDPLDEFEAVINRTLARGGTVIIPAFAVGRAQSVMLALHQLKTAHRIPHVPVYLDSPMAVRATDILERHLNEHHLSRDLCDAITSSVQYIDTPEDSKALNHTPFPKIIIAASGMATGGRVLHHIRNLAPDPKNTILFTGFQAAGTRGDRILRGEREVKMLGTLVPIRAEVALIDTMSAHADYTELLDWMGHMRKAPILTFITHGEYDAAQAMQHHMDETLGWPSVIPDQEQTFSL